MSLTKEDLAAIGALITASEERTSKEITRQLNLMVEQYFDPRFKLLADAIGEINEKMATKDDLEAIDVRLDAHEAVLMAYGRDIRKLKKAQ